MKKIQYVFAVIFILSSFTLTSCKSVSPDINFTNTSASSITPVVSESIDAEITEYTAVTTENSLASEKDLQSIIDSVEFPQVTITENSSPNEILLAGKTLGIYYRDAVKKYFGYGTDLNWKLDYENTEPFKSDNTGTYQTSNTYWTAKGLYTARADDVYAPMNYAEAKQFMMEYIKLTEQGFEDLCCNSPSSYMDINGMLGVSSGDGGDAGWSYSCILDYELSGNTVTYNCQRVGLAEEWGYDENLIQPFTFSLAYENDVWQLDGCSYSEGLFDLIGLESDIENLDIQILLNKFSAFSYSYLECKDIRECINENSFITTQEVSDNGSTYEKKWYEIVTGDVLSVNDLNTKISELFTDEMIDELNIEDYYLEQDGKLYLSEFAGNDGGLLGTDISYITSIEKSDNIIIVNLTAFGDKNNWGLTEDFTENFSIELSKNDNGFKINKCDIAARSYITWTYLSENDIF